MDFMGMAGVTAITIICYLIGEVVKILPLDNKWVPAICGIAGAALGYAAMFIMPDFPAADIITALAIGIVSGLAATGVNQVWKQMKE